MNPEPDFYFEKGKWQQEIKLLRKTVLACRLTETLKWGCPCYTMEGANIVLIHVFKEYCALLFFKGALLHNSTGILIQQTKNVQAAGQIRFTNTKEIVQQTSVLKACIAEAIAVEKAGLKPVLKKTAAFGMPEAFKTKLAKTAALKKAFDALTPGRQRSWLLYFGAAKQAKTLDTRIEKAIPLIQQGKGYNER